jgi:hypothetical protein
MNEIQKSLLRDPSGKVSAMRVVLIGWFLIVLIFWFIASVKAGQPADIPAGLAALMGSLGVGKAIQAVGEYRKP